MKSLVVASILVAMTASTFAQSTKTTSPEGTMTESQKGGPAARDPNQTLAVKKRSPKALGRRTPRRTWAAPRPVELQHRNNELSIP
jgi:hypothetical protein